MRRLVLLLLAAEACGAPAGAPTERVTIPPGATVRTVADSLAAHGIISGRTWFRLVARVGAYQRRVQSGTFEFRRGAGAIAALRALASGRAVLIRLTVPEGYTLIDIAEETERTLAIPRERFLAAARDSVLLREYGVPAPSFEGYLLPETYLFAAGVSAGTVVRELAQSFRAGWRPGWDSSGAAQGLDRATIVTLASIVEGEARMDADRPLIAAAYRNRLRLGMPLQADPTVQYAIQLATGALKPRLYEKDYDFASSYNTYLHPGLPPGPVGAPGRKSIEAVLAPAPVPYLYFVAGPDGRHVFTRTYAEHLRVVRRIQHAR